MPELIEVEQYRAAAQATIGRRIRSVSNIDDHVARPVDPAELADELTGRRITAAARRGKVLLLRTDGPTIGLRFGMTGRLVVDGTPVIGELVYGSSRDDERFDRVVIGFDPAGELRLRDPRRLGRIVLDPELASLGPDAASIGVADLRLALTGRRAVKAVLLDQARIAGLGNLLVDDALFRAAISPTRPVDRLTADEVRRLARSIRTTVSTLSRRGGSHTGDLQAERKPGGVCPADGAALRRAQVGGRTTFWCPLHQR